MTTTTPSPFSPTTSKQPSIAVWFSCGAASAVAAKLTLEKYASTHKIHIVNNPVIEEGLDNRRFLADVEAWLGHPIEIASHPQYPSNSAEDVWATTRGMSFPSGGATCTRLLKKEARQIWELSHRVDWHVLGFTWEEIDRHERFIRAERANVLPILIEAKLTKQACLNIVANAGLALPIHYKLGYPNANCFGCVKATSASYWNLVRRTMPDVFDRRAEQSRELGVRLVRVKGRRMFLDELDEDARSKPLKSLRMPECGIFCEDKPKGGK